MSRGKVLIAVASDEEPPLRGSHSVYKIRRQPGDGLEIQSHTRGDTTRQCMVEIFLESDYEWIFFVDADMVIPPDALEKLLAHGVDIVSGLYFRRELPVKPVAYAASEQWPLCPLLDYPQEGLVPIGAAGFGCLLVHRRVFEAIQEKVLRPGEPFICNGPLAWRATTYETIGADIRFTQMAIKCGFDAWLDPQVKCGHIAHVAVGEEHYINQGKGLLLRTTYEKLVEARIEGGYSVLDKEVLELEVKKHQEDLQALGQEMQQLESRRQRVANTAMRHQGAIIELRRLIELAEKRDEELPVEAVTED